MLASSPVVCGQGFQPFTDGRRGSFGGCPVELACQSFTLSFSYTYNSVQRSRIGRLKHALLWLKEANLPGQ